MLIVQITKATPEQDILRRVNTELDAAVLVAQRTVPADGYRVIGEEAYPNNPVDGSKRPGSTLVVKIYGENGITDVPADTPADARAIINGLAQSDGFSVLDVEQPLGSKHTRTIAAKPPLWRVYYDEGQYVGSRENSHGRTEADRI